MIQDIAPHRLYNHYDPSLCPSAESFVMVFRGGGEVLLADPSCPGQVVYPRVQELFGEDVPNLRYLFSIDEDRYFLYPADGAAADTEDGPAIDGSGREAEGRLRIPDGFGYRNIRSLRRMDLGPREAIFAAYTGEQVFRWYRDNRFCGTCGSRTVHSETERAIVCPACGRTIYPRIQPAVIVGVLSKGRLLTTKYADRPHTFWALVAGFTEIGETVEETVSREVMEEAGLKVKNLRYYKSQPWGIADDILMGFFCDVDGDDTIRLDRAELREGKWCTPESIELQPTDFALTGEMMRIFKEGRVPGCDGGVRYGGDGRN